MDGRGARGRLRRGVAPEEGAYVENPSDEEGDDEVPDADPRAPDEDEYAADDVEEEKDDDQLTEEDLEELKVHELKELLKARSLTVGGNKPDLIARLLEHQNEQQEQQQEDEVQQQEENEEQKDADDGGEGGEEEEEKVDSFAEPPHGENGIPKPKMSFNQMMGTLAMLAPAYKPPNESNFPEGTWRREMIKQSDEAYKFLKDTLAWLDGEAFWTPEEGGYDAGIALPLISDGFPSAMAPIVKDESKASALNKAGYGMWAYVSAYIDGDGTICGLLRRISRPAIGVAIKGNCAFKRLLEKVGFTRGTSGCFMPVTRENVRPDATQVHEDWGARQRVTMRTGLAEFLVLKRPQWLIVNQLSHAARLLMVGLYSPVTKFARFVLSWVLSSLNNNHGADMPVIFFEERLRYIERYGDDVGDGGLVHPIYLYKSLAGLYGSDGSVGIATKDGECILCQSCEPYLQAIANVMNRVFRFPEGDQLQVTPHSRARSVLSPRARPHYVIIFRPKQVRRIVLQIGSFDYNRRAQWTVLLVLLMVQGNVRDGAQKTKLVIFLKDLLIVIKILCPS